MHDESSQQDQEASLLPSFTKADARVAAMLDRAGQADRAGADGAMLDRIARSGWAARDVDTHGASLAATRHQGGRDVLQFVGAGHLVRRREESAARWRVAAGLGIVGAIGAGLLALRTPSGVGSVRVERGGLAVGEGKAGSVVAEPDAVALDLAVLDALWESDPADQARSAQDLWASAATLDETLRDVLSLDDLVGEGELSDGLVDEGTDAGQPDGPAGGQRDDSMGAVRGGVGGGRGRQIDSGEGSVP